MADPVLVNGQYSIGKPGGPSIVYGAGTQLLVNNTATDTGTMNVQDQAVVGQDGTQFGTDTLPGMIITQGGYAYVANNGRAALDAYGTLAGMWNDPSVRLVPGVVQTLRACYPYSNVTRRCYGRGRKIVPAYGQVFQGVVPFTAQFQAADGIWYSDTLYSTQLTTAPVYGGGIVPPLTPPLIPAAQINPRQNVIVNTGPQPTWPVIAITGPIFSPVLYYVGTPVTIGYLGQIPAGQTLIIDSQPWARTALIGLASAAGQLTGSAMTSLQLQPGATVASFGGQDLTGTATCVVSWRSANLSIGGST